ncbi:MAG: T9SS type A sorting domain-containing protein [Bacteroidota bacterium]
MKTILISVVLVFAALFGKSQVWAPPGATWHYDWVEMATDGFAKVQYVKDSIVGGKLCKVLKIEEHTYNWITQTYNNSVIGYEYTWLDNEVVYYYRYNQFFKLYDFNSISGSSWEVAGWNQNNPCDSAGSIIVDSTGTTTINSFSLKYLKVSPGQNSDWEFPDKIIERIGCLGYMFPLPNCIIDIPGPGQLRCYYDDEFGLYQLTGFPPSCDYIIGVDENRERKNDIKIYPVPTVSTFTFEMNRPEKGNLFIQIFDVLGNKIKEIETGKMKLVIDIQNFKEGVYFLVAIDQDGFIFSQKIIKTGTF